uniref:Uncharacterized protein n=1 Tax=Avena sativa TaxID=4498 RepID=A0ACD5TIK4_AVESA
MQVSGMGNRSRPSVAKETMEPIDEEAESPSREAQLDRHHRSKCADGKSGEMYLDRIPNFHCKSLPTRRLEANSEDSVMHSRGSMYQSSSDVSRLRKLQQGRGKLDSAYGRDAFMSFGTADSSSQPSTSGACLVPERSRSGMSRSSMNRSRESSRDAREFLEISSREVPNENSRTGRPQKDCNLLTADVIDGFLQLSVEEDTAKRPCSNTAPHLLEGSGSRGARSSCQYPVGVHPDAVNHGESDLVSNLPKSLSAKAGVSDAACPSEGADGKRKARSNPFKKIMDPFMKSKSMRNPSRMEMEDEKCGNAPVRGKDSALRKSFYWVDSVMNESKHPMELFVKGNQEVLPALSMKVDGKGDLSVDFHARLSALQAFSVCISLLHCSEASSAIGVEKFKHKLYSSSMKILLKEEVKQLIESVTGKEKKKVKRRKGKTQSILNGPPFSPMGRV